MKKPDVCRNKPHRWLKSKTCIGLIYECQDCYVWTRKVPAKQMSRGRNTWYLKSVQTAGTTK